MLSTTPKQTDTIGLKVTRAMMNKILFGTVFITGAAVLILEVAAVRILSPIYGSSLYVLSSVLTVILGALSVGYWYGGKRADKEHSIDALYTIITISGVTVLGLLLISKWLLPTFGPTLPTTIGPLLFSLGLFFIPSFLLGIVSPYIIKLQSLTTPTEKIGTVVGATFFWGTLGSIFGSLATGFILIPNFGVTQTIVMVSAGLMLLGLLTPLFIGGQNNKKKIVVTFILAAIISNTIYHFEPIDKNTIYEAEGIYSNIKIKNTLIENRPGRILLRDTNQSSAIFLGSKKISFPYLRFSLLYDTLVANPKRALFLGGGAYTAPRTLAYQNPNLKIDVVEIEPILFTLAQQYFDLGDTSNITNYVMDARVFLNQHQEIKYDFIFGDVFSTNQAPPFHLTTQEFYAAVADHLSPDGVFILNTVGSIETIKPSISGSTAKTLQSVFPTIATYGLNEDLTSLQNIVFIARNNTNPIDINLFKLLSVVGNTYKIPITDFKFEDELLLTDDHAPIEFLMSRYN